MSATDELRAAQARIAELEGALRARAEGCVGCRGRRTVKVAGIGCINETACGQCGWLWRLVEGQHDDPSA